MSSDTPIEIDPATMPMDELTALVHHKAVELKARTQRVLPIGTIRFECLLDFILTPDSPERDTFERVAAARLLQVAEDALVEARQQALLRP